MYEEQLVWPPLLRGLLLALPLPAFVAALATPRGSVGAAVRLLPLVLVLGVVALVWSTTTLRLRVDSTGVTIRMGLFSEHIPRARIVAWEPVAYRWIEYGGFGVRWRPGRRLYNVPGDGGRALQLTLDNGRLLLCSSRNPEAACRMLDGMQ